MNAIFTGHLTGFARLKLFWALSRTPHGLLDMAMPALAALVWLGGFPPLDVALLGLLTAFAGYTAVYALNDLVDIRIDKEKLGLGTKADTAEIYLDAMFIRHPLAQGALSFTEGLVWTLGWALVALVGAWLLNPVCLLIFLGGALLEAVYCLLLKITHFRALVSGAVKTSGALAAVFAVDPAPDPGFLALLFGWIFLWEIGGQNVPNDWVDLEEDRRLKARTIPVRFGPGRSTFIILLTLGLAVAGHPLLLLASQTPFSYGLSAASLATGLVLLVVPAFRLHRRPGRGRALALFNRASYYPGALFMLTAVYHLA